MRLPQIVKPATRELTHEEYWAEVDANLMQSRIRRIATANRLKKAGAPAIIEVRRRPIQRTHCQQDPAPPDDHWIIDGDGAFSGHWVVAWKSADGPELFDEFQVAWDEAAVRWGGYQPIVGCIDSAAAGQRWWFDLRRGNEGRMLELFGAQASSIILA